MKESITERERFFSKVSHDLRGSFTSILGFSDIVNDPNENLSRDEIMEFVDRIGKQSHESFELLVNFVNWLKLEKYTYGLTKEKIEIFDVCNELKLQYQVKYKDRNININLELTESVFVSMDFEIFHSIMNNIFSFLMNICCEDISILSKTNNPDSTQTVIEIYSECNNSSLQQNSDLRDLNNDIAFPIIFAIKFTELSGGEFDYSFDDNNLSIKLTLPNN